MAVSASAAAQEEARASSYRIKFRREQFLELVRMARPQRIYRVKNVHFFSFDGFVMYSQECKDEDLGVRVIEAIEFSNYSWQKK